MSLLEGLAPAAAAIAALAAASTTAHCACLPPWAYPAATGAACVALAVIRAAGLGERAAHAADLARMKAAQAALAGAVVELEKAVGGGAGGGGRERGTEPAARHQHAD